MPQASTVLITGATSGLGHALALEYARTGVPLALTGRDEERLERVAREARALGSETAARALDVTDAGALREWILETDRERPLELVIANAGIFPSPMSGEDGDEAAKVFRVNVGGVANTVLPALEGMRRRRAGRIAVMSSLASFTPLPMAPAYSASKFAVRTWSEGLRMMLWKEGVRTCAVCPGFIRTPMTEGVPSPMPFLMDADRAARIVVRGLRRMPARLAFPRHVYWMVRLWGALPESVRRMDLARSKPAPAGG